MMKPAVQFILGCLLLGFAGCQSVESQKRVFADIHNGQIGSPFFTYEKPGMKEVRISDTMSEFVPEVIPVDRAVVAWTVDTTTRGPYHHRNGMTFQIEGLKKSWRVLGDPELARTSISWLTPW